MELLMIKNEYYKDRFEIKDKLRTLGFYGRKFPKNLDQVPDEFKHLFEMVKPDFVI